MFNKIPKEFIANIVHLAVVATIVKIICSIFFKLYSSLWKYAGTYELVNIVVASFISNSIMLSYIYIMQIKVPRSIFLITIMLDIFLIGGIRFAYRVFRRIVRGEVIRIKNSKRILIVGGGDAGAIIVKELKLHPDLKSVPVAIIDDDLAKRGKKLNSVPIVGGSAEI